MPAVAALLCCCDTQTGPCGGLPSALLMEWSGSIEVNFNGGQCILGSPGWLIGSVIESGMQKILTLQENICQYAQPGCTESHVFDMLYHSCASGNESADSIETSPCMNLFYNVPQQRWYVMVNPLKLGPFGGSPTPFPQFGWGNPAKYWGPVDPTHTDPRGTYSYDSGQFCDPGPFTPQWDVTVSPTYGSVTIS